MTKKITKIEEQELEVIQKQQVEVNDAVKKFRYFRNAKKWYY